MADTNKRVRERWLVLVVTLAISSVTVATACSKPQVGGAGGTEEDTTIQKAKPEDGLNGPPEGHAAVMVRYAQQLAFGEGVPESDIIDQELPCEPDASACDNHETVRIRIVPANHGPDVDWKDVLHPAQGRNPNGHIVAKVTNMTEAPFAPLKLGPHDVGYLWIGPVGLQGTPRKAALYKLGPGRAEILATSTDPLICAKAKPTPSVHLYPMLGCAQSYAPSMNKSSVEPFSALISYFVRSVRSTLVHTSGLWVGCSNGCCQVQMSPT